MSDVILQLDEMQFEGVEIPQSIIFGGKQNTVSHDLIGGTRIVDSMGAFSSQMKWSGMFVGERALERVRYLDGLRIAGRQLSLTWSELSYKVVMSELAADFHRSYQIPYTITLDVVKDEAQVQTQLVSSQDSLIEADTTAASSLVATLQATPAISAGSVTTGTMAGAFATLQSAIKTVSSFATATQSQLNSVLQPLAAMRHQVQTLMATVNNTLSSVTTLGGILPNNPVSQSVARLGGQLTAMQQHPLLLNLDRVVGRIGVNMQASYKTEHTTTQVGGDLYTLAAKEYGDSMAWTALAKANSLSDPHLTGVNTLVIPPAPGKSDGVLEY